MYEREEGWSGERAGTGLTRGELGVEGVIQGVGGGGGGRMQLAAVGYRNGLFVDTLHVYGV